MVFFPALCFHYRIESGCIGNGWFVRENGQWYKFNVQNIKRTTWAGNGFLVQRWANNMHNTHTNKHIFQLKHTSMLQHTESNQFEYDWTEAKGKKWISNFLCIFKEIFFVNSNKLHLSRKSTTNTRIVCGWDLMMVCSISFTGNEIIDLITQENDIYSENVQRITVDTDWADGLISR